MLFLPLKRLFLSINNTFSMMDKQDERILDILKGNARISFADLGRIIDLSPSAVRERMQKMEDAGIIKGYEAVLDTRKLGFELEAFMLFKVFPGQLKNVISLIKDFPEIKEAHRITGSQNIHLKIVVKNQFHLQKLLDQLMVYGDTTTYLILSEI